MCSACRKPEPADWLAFHKRLCGYAICRACYFRRQDQRRVV